MEKEKIIISNFNSVIDNPNNKKFERLNNDLFYKSKHFKLENENTNPKRKYPYFKRGTLLFIDFGVNLYSEFSGPHYAVVLNKNDHSNNPVITVIPLSSKQKKHYVEIKPGIAEFIDGYAQICWLDLKYRSDVLQNELNKMKTLLESDPKLITTMDEIVKQGEELQLLSKNFKEFEKILINSKDKRTFVNPTNIITISKNRIKRSSNPYDIHTKLIFTKEGMKPIDDAIKRNLLFD